MRRPKTDSRLRVLTFARDAGSGYGGAEKIAFEFARRLDERRFHSYLCTTRAPDASRVNSVIRDRAVLAAEGVQTLDLNRTSHAALLQFRRVYELLARESIDIVHAHMPRASVPGALLARLTRVPVVVSHEHGSALEGKIFRRLLDRQVVARLSTRMLAVSEWDRRNLVEHERIAPELIEVLPNGIPKPVRQGSDLRAELGIPAGVPLIGAIGRLMPEKGYDDLIRAVGILRREGRELRCVILGDGAQEGALRALIDEQEVAELVQLPGRRSDVHDVIAALDVAVMCSRREGSPLAAIEYMAGSAPIVATAVGGLPELIEHERDGLLVPPGDPAALAGAIWRLVADRELAQRLGQAAGARQRANYDLDVIVRRLERLYLELYDQVAG